MNRVTIFVGGKGEQGYDFVLGKVNRVMIFLGKGEQGYDFVGGKVNSVTILFGER